MNIIWSKYVQGVKTLYFSRRLRFHDMFAEQYQTLFDLSKETAAQNSGNRLWSGCSGRRSSPLVPERRDYRAGS